MIIQAWQRPDLSEERSSPKLHLQENSWHPPETIRGCSRIGAGADDSRLVKASQAEAGPGASAPPWLEPPVAAAADEK